MNWLHYLVEANLYLAVFYTGYYLFLSRETHYTLNRAYLLFSSVLSFILPVMQLGILKPAEPQITAVNFAPIAQGAFVNAVPALPVEQPFNWQPLIIYGYITGALILLLVLLVKLYQLFKLTKIKSTRPDNEYKLIYLNDSDSAFSFFNFLFIGTKAGGADTIIKHELVHIRQKHSADVIFMELLKIINWFNPFIYLLQHSLRAIHEYIADEETVAANADAHAYSSFLVNNAYGLSGSSITHSFFNYNLLKKRIIMLHQKRSGNLARLKYLLAIPISAGLLCASTLAFSKTYGWVNIGPHRIDKNNKTAQVKEPARRLMVTKDGISTITDKFLAKRPDGTTRAYTAYNISNKDKADLKAKGIIINVISDVKTDTIKTHLAPPPAPPVTRVKFPLPNPMTTHTSKGYYYSEAFYTTNGKTDVVVTFKEKNGKVKDYDKDKLTASEIADLQKIYAYTFPTHFRHLPPPPPPAPPIAPVAAKNHKVPPQLVVPDRPVAPVAPVAAQAHKVPLRVVPDQPVTAQNQMKPPPPPPFEYAYKDFFDYLAKVTLYPAKALDNNVMGVAVAQYTLDANHHITNILMRKGNTEVFNESIFRALKSYNGSINKAPGMYAVVFRFAIAGKTNTDEVREDDGKLTQTPNYTGEITIVGYKN